MLFDQRIIESEIGVLYPRQLVELHLALQPGPPPDCRPRTILFVRALGLGINPCHRHTPGGIDHRLPPVITKSTPDQSRGGGGGGGLVAVRSWVSLSGYQKLRERKHL